MSDASTAKDLFNPDSSYGPIPLVYGPLKSRRFGQFLGINPLSPDTKMCSLDCCYCDLGPTEMKVHEIRKSTLYPNPTRIYESLDRAIKELNPLTPLNSLVISGNGEPTLHPQIYEVVKSVVETRDKLLEKVPIFLLTHGGHVDNRRIIAALNMADERVIKLDAGNDPLYKMINQPRARIHPNKIITASKILNDMIVQAMFVQGVYDNTKREDIEDWIEVVGMIRPKLVQLCTPSRPHSTPGLKSVSEDTLDVIATLLRRRVNTETEIYP